ncbi:hypothetical protein DM01DRAFT_1387031 [Hesseltinella vesiculosa]|uniref:DUF202 domain-containing protein n=1 Tax=Hesseltinella vesiculosa TaxID=101127 RepID=A0A1X2G3K7_9FUNG|nr:hypothetical protein DM01DRAFT_1387031 [Hesseltinella vesiculosa]
MDSPDAPFILCNNDKCSTRFKYLDCTIHTKVTGPDPRDHFANERNLLTWIRTGMTLSLIGFMVLLDITQRFAPSTSFPWPNEPLDTKRKAVAYLFVALGLLSIIVATFTYFRNQRHIIKRMLFVGQGWVAYLLTCFIALFVCFVMIMSLTESRPKA